MTARARRFPVGAEVDGDGHVHVRAWAPAVRGLEVVVQREDGAEVRATALDREPGGWFSGIAEGARDGSLYRFRLDGRETYPDPASRFQPQGPHGPSQVVDTTRFRWTDARWNGIPFERHVIYEMHVGTFTRAGTLRAAMDELPRLAELGITTLELMPLAEFAGRFGWGYDGVDLFAPFHGYGAPDDLAAFVDRAHAADLAVILDVVYNHFGPDGNFMSKYAPQFFSRKKTEWGEAINYDGEDSGPVRDFVTANAAYWISEYHFDGLRLDATQNIYDTSPEHVITALARRVREAGRGRQTYLVAENESQETWLVAPADERGGALDALWNDDFHHSALVALTGHTEAYYTDYTGTPQEFISALKYGYLFQGQYYVWQHKRRGTPAWRVPQRAFVNYLENHDQVSNLGLGKRLCWISHPGAMRAMSAVLLLAPNVPMLFQGQEFSSDAPFLYFADHNPELAPLVHEGRKDFLSQFASVSRGLVDLVPDPADVSAFESSKLDFRDRETNRGVWEMHRDLLALRHGDPMFFDAARRRGFDGAVLAEHAFVLRWFGDGADGAGDRILVVNLGRDLPLRPSPEPLLAPPPRTFWDVEWSSEDPRYGGNGTAPPETATGWVVPGYAALLLRPAEGDAPPDPREPRPEQEQPQEQEGEEP